MNKIWQSVCVDGFLNKFDVQMVQKGRGLGSRDPISKFGDPLITFEGIEIRASNLAQT